VFSSISIVREIKERDGRGMYYVRGRGDIYRGLRWGNQRERDRLEDQDIDGDNIKMDLQEVGCGVMDWIELAQDRDRWWALVNALMNLRVP